MAESKQGFILYADLVHVVRKLIENDRKNNTNDSGELFLQVLEYVNDTNPVAKNFIVEMAFEPIKLQLKRDLKNWESIRKKRVEAGSIGGKQRQANASKAKQSLANQAVIVNGNVNVNDTVTVNVKEKVRTGFTPPTISEVKDYCLERKNSVDPDKWFNHYLSNGWMVGKNKMKEWKAAIRTWERNQYSAQYGVEKPKPNKVESLLSISEKLNLPE